MEKKLLPSSVIQQVAPTDKSIFVADDAQTEFPSANWRRPLILGWALILFGVGGSFAWGALAPLDSAVFAPGEVSVESNRKTVQHFEGGIIREISARDGDFVVQDQLLFRLDDTQARANLEVVRSQRAAMLAEEARLLSEHVGQDTIDFPQEVLSRKDDPIVAQAIIDHQRILMELKGYRVSQFHVLEARIRQEEEELKGSGKQQIAGLKQIEWVDKELPGLRDLYEKGLVQWTRITGLERQRAQLEGVVANAEANHARLEHSINETRLQITELTSKFQQEIAAQIAAIRKQLAEVNQRQMVAQDVLNRLEVRAPQAGVVQGSRIFTLGAVVRAGDPLLDIVPLNDELVVRAKVSPLNMDIVHAGMKAEIRFPSFHLPYVPTMYGMIKTVSFDRLEDEKSGDSYFAATVTAEKKTLPSDIQDKLRAGMPVEVILIAGERTAFQYMLQPLTDRLRKGMREH